MENDEPQSQYQPSAAAGELPPVAQQDLQAEASAGTEHMQDLIETQ